MTIEQITALCERFTSLERRVVVLEQLMRNVDATLKSAHDASIAMAQIENILAIKIARLEQDGTE